MTAATAEVRPAPVLSLLDVASRIGASVDTIRSRIKIDPALKGLTFRAGGVVLIRAEDVEVFRQRVRMPYRELRREPVAAEK